MIQIKHRHTGAVLCEFDVETVKEAVVKAVENGAYLGDAYLNGAYLEGEKLIIALYKFKRTCGTL